jgi:acyl carrier protein
MDSLKLIYESIDELNLDMEEAEQIRKSEDTQLFGTGDSLDSLQLVNLITIVEQKIEEETGSFVALADERAMSMEESPFKTVASLKNYIDTLLKDI